LKFKEFKNQVRTYYEDDNIDFFGVLIWSNCLFLFKPS